MRYIIVAQTAPDKKIGVDYLYWTGVSWNHDIKRARFHETEDAAEKEMTSLSPPRVLKPGTVPEVIPA